jgi:4-hydroxythreonine-4-phosphate dehydrogenase
MGCPAGIGPEIILKSVTALSETALPPLVVIGDGKVLERCGRELGMPAAIKYWQPGMVPEKGVLNLYSLSSFGPELRWGHPDGETGRAMGRYIEEP